MGELVRTKVVTCLSLMVGLAGVAVAQQTQNVIGGQVTTYNGVVGSGARAWGMGGAFVAVADDASAASWNPAGIAILRQPEFMFVYVPTDNGTYSEPGFVDEFAAVIYSGATSRREGSNIDYLGMTFPVWSANNRRLVLQGAYHRAVNLNQSIHLNTPEVTALPQYDDGSVSGPLQYLDQDWKSEGGYDLISGTAAFGFGSRLSFGVTLNYWRVDTNYRQAEELILLDSTQGLRLSGQRDFSLDGDGFSYNLGMMARFGSSDEWAVGLVYKSEAEISGDTSNVASGYSNLDELSPLEDFLVTSTSANRAESTFSGPRRTHLVSRGAPRRSPADSS